jgi:hypothetical protein
MLIDIKTYDGYIIKGRVSLPEGEGEISKLVIYIPGSGYGEYATYNGGFPETFFTDKGIAYFTFNKRGLYVTDEPPFYSVNNEESKTYFPSNCIVDIYEMIKELRLIERLAKCKILLNGWSEGAQIAPLFASKYPGIVDALFLCGYPNDNLKDLQKHLLEKIEGGNEAFENVINAVEQKDSEWLMKNNGPPLEWLLDHYNLKSNNDLLPTLDLPIYIFHGVLDEPCDVKGVYKIRDVFNQLGKFNLISHVFENHDHNLDANDSSGGTLSTGKKVFLDAVYNF